MPEPVSSMKILVAEETEVLQKGIESMLEEAGIAPNIFCVRSGNELMQLAPFYKPEILIMNNDLPGIPVKECIARLRNTLSCITIVLFKEKLSPKLAFSYMRLGCKGFLPVTANVAHWKQAINTTLNGQQYYFGDGMAHDLSIHTLKILDKLNNPHPVQFTAKEKLYFNDIREGFTNKQIGIKHNRSIKTIEKAVRNMLVKTGTHKRVAMVITALRKGMMTDPEI